MDLMERKLGDLVRDLEKQRAELRSQLDKINAQLELLAKLASPVSKPTKSSTTQAAPSTPATTKSKPATKRKRGRPKGSIAKAKSAHKPAAAATAKPEQKGKTLKEELFAIAKTHGGKFRVKEAAKQLVKSGRYGTTEQAAMNVHAAIKYYKKNFVKEGTERGVYKVKGA